MPFSDHADVVVIGGGPAGSTVARYLAKEGVDVLVIDGRESIGSPLQCGELVPSNAELCRLCPDVPEIAELFQTPEAVVSCRVDELHVIAPSGKRLAYPFEGVMLDRVAHDEALVERAQSLGARYLVGKRVDQIGADYVQLRDGSSISAKIIVGAGGHNDPVRRDFWDEKSLKIPVKFVLMDGYVPDALEFYFGSLAPGGYAWAFPKKGGANVGLGVQPAMAKGANVNTCTDRFISRFSGDAVFKGAGSLPMSGTIKRFVKENYVLVGDAAGMVLPSNGAGITIAMIGGRIAGQVIAAHIQSGVPLVEYERRWSQQMGKVMRNSKRSFRLGSILFRCPDWVINMAFNRLTKPIIWRAITCRRMFWIV